MKRFFIYFIISILFLSSCKKDNSEITNPNIPEENFTFLPFINIKNSRMFIVDNTINNKLVVFNSLADQQSFFDTVETHYYFNNINYTDSIVIGLIYPQEISMSCSFSIDSLLVDSSKNEILVKSHLFKPKGNITIKSIQSHFISISRTNYNIIATETKIVNEIYSGELVPFRSFLNNDDGFETDVTKSFLVLFRSKEEETNFLDSIPYFYGMRPFPNFTYGDSILVGVIASQFPNSAPFELISIEHKQDTVYVTAQLVDPIASFSVIIHPLHFVAIRKIDLPFKLNNIIYINEIIK